MRSGSIARSRCSSIVVDKPVTEAWCLSRLYVFSVPMDNFSIRVHTTRDKFNRRLDFYEIKGDDILRAIGFKDVCSGSTSPLSKITLSDEMRLVSHIPQEAVYFCWAYQPKIDLSRIQKSHLPPSVKKFLTYGGFVYTDHSHKIVHINAVDTTAEDANGVLQFGPAQKWDDYYTEELCLARRFNPVTICENGPQFYCWLAPKEILGGRRLRQVFRADNLGCFVYLFSKKPLQKHPSNCFFAVTGGEEFGSRSGSQPNSRSGSISSRSGSLVSSTITSNMSLNIGKVLIDDRVKTMFENHMSDIVGLEELKVKLKEIVRVSLTDPGARVPHVILIGERNCGRQTLARRYANILKEAEIISNSKIVATKASLHSDRKSLINKVRESRGGLALVRVSQPLVEDLELGIVELLKMRDVVVVLAGSGKNLYQIVEKYNLSVPVLKFPEYTLDDLAQIWDRMVRAAHCSFDPELREMGLAAFLEKEAPSFDMKLLSQSLEQITERAIYHLNSRIEVGASSVERTTVKGVDVIKALNDVSSKKVIIEAKEVSKSALSWFRESEVRVLRDETLRRVSTAGLGEMMNLVKERRDLSNVDDVATSTQGLLPIHLAAMEGDLDLISLLISKSVDVNQGDFDV